VIGPDPGSVDRLRDANQLARDASRRRGSSREPRRAVWIGTLSTIIFFGAVGLAIVNAPNWPLVQRSFFDPAEFRAALPGLIAAFGTNVKLFLIAEVLILVLALVVAVLRSLPGPVFVPIRVLMTIYVDLFRALPGLLVIFFLGFGIPALGIPGVPTDPFFWAVVALTLLYSAYVSEVYRAGIESVHANQAAAARSLGLSQWQALRFVVLPQAVRRVVPPLLNDFISLQKDTALVAILGGVIEANRAAQIYSASVFNYSSFTLAALLFLVVTIPLARFTDHLIARDRRRRQAGTS
jgi:polar amino acid transport system permease protein